MSWICQSVPILPPHSNFPSLMYQFRKIDPKTQQINVVVQQVENSVKLAISDDWRRIKIMSHNVQEMMRSLRQNRSNFVDAQFPHTNAKIARDYFDGEIEWKRVGKLIQNAVYSREHTSANLQHLKINRKAFEKALILIARCNSTIFKELVSKTLNEEGLYQFKIFKDGYIQNVVIDDYIPSHRGIPIFVGPARFNEVYPILIEKALAKVCGTYEDIPQNVEQILEMIACGPVSTYLINDLKKDSRLASTIGESVRRHGLIVAMSKEDPKIKHYGLNERQVYLIINRYQISWGDLSQKQLRKSKVSQSQYQSLVNTVKDYNQMEMSKFRILQSSSLNTSGVNNINKKIQLKNSETKQENTTKEAPKLIQFVFQCVSESKVSAWNGRFSLNDNVWDKVEPTIKMQIYKQIKNNGSFIINQSDISRHFDDLLIFEADSVKNKDWTENQSINGFVSFTNFNVLVPDQIFIRVMTPSRIRQVAILVREIEGKRYEFVQSNYSESNSKLELVASVLPGKYLLGVCHQWFINKSGQYYVFLSSNSHIGLKKGGSNDKNFLINAILSYEEQRNPDPKQQKQECTIRFELNKLGLAYLILRPQNSKTKQLHIAVDQKYLQKEGWDLFQPYTGLSSITVTNKSQKTESLIVLIKKDIQLGKKGYFPTAAFTIKK